MATYGATSDDKVVKLKSYAFSEQVWYNNIRLWPCKIMGHREPISFYDWTWSLLFQGPHRHKAIGGLVRTRIKIVCHWFIPAAVIYTSVQPVLVGTMKIIALHIADMTNYRIRVTMKQSILNSSKSNLVSNWLAAHPHESLTWIFLVIQSLAMIIIPHKAHQQHKIIL